LNGKLRAAFVVVWSEGLDLNILLNKSISLQTNAKPILTFMDYTLRRR